MADPQTTADSGAKDTSLDIDKLMAQAQGGGASAAPIMALMKRDQEETARYEREMEPVRKKYIERLDKSQQQEDEFYKRIEPLRFPEQPQKKDYMTDPASAFGSFASVFAQIAAGFTHQPMINALNAGAAAMNAIKQNDYENYHDAYSAWKDNTALALDRHKAMMEEWQALRDKNKDDMSAYDAEMTMFGARHGDEIALFQRQSGMLQDYESIMQGRQNAAISLLGIMPELERRHVQYTGLLNDPDWKDGDSTQKAQAAVRWGIIQTPYGGRMSALNAEKYQVIEDLKNDWRKNHPGQTMPAQVEAQIVNDGMKGGLTGNVKAKYEGKISQLDLNLDKIDQVLNVLQTHVGAAGLSGRAERLGEVVGNLLGSNSTDYVQFRRDIETLQASAGRLLTGADGRPLSADSAKVNDVVAGLNLGDTTANTIRALQSLRDWYLSDRQDVLGILGGDFQPGGAPLGGGPAPAPGAQPPAGGTPWANDPIVGH